MKLRDQPFSVAIDDGVSGGVTSFYKVGESRLFVVCENSIFEFMSADSLDPLRKNMSLPHVHQKVLSVGSNDPRVRRILLTAEVLFKLHSYGPVPSLDEVRLAAFDCLKEVVFLDDTLNDLKVAEQLAIKDFPETYRAGSVVKLPHIPNLSAITHSYVLASERVFRAIERLVRSSLSGTVPNNWVDYLLRDGLKKLNENPEAAGQIAQVCDFLRLVNSIRIATVHPKINRKMDVTDFRMGDDGKVYPPTISLSDSSESLKLSPLLIFMEQTNLSLVNSIEAMIVWLREETLTKVGALEPFVGTTPEELFEKGQSSYRLYANLNGQACPYG
jgi:hypothetical protein